MKRWMLLIIVGFVSGAAIDLRDYLKVKKWDLEAKFDFGEAIPKWILGSIIGASAAISAEL